MESAVNQHIGVQTEHLQEDEVTVCLEEVTLDLCHIPQTQATWGLVDDVERHLSKKGRWLIKISIFISIDHYALDIYSNHGKNPFRLRQKRPIDYCT